MVGASQPRHMGYMQRLGMYGPGTSFAKFAPAKEEGTLLNVLEAGGLGAMGPVAMGAGGGVIRRI